MARIFIRNCIGRDLIRVYTFARIGVSVNMNSL
jgi:hypothetical protein